MFGFTDVSDQGINVGDGPGGSWVKWGVADGWYWIIAEVRLGYDRITLDPSAGIEQVERFLSEYLFARARMIEVGLIRPF